MADSDLVSMHVQHVGLEALARVLKEQEDGKQLRRELAKNMREALTPAATLARSGIMAMSSAGPGTSPGLRSEIAKKIRPEVKLSGRWTGARVKARKLPGTRAFANAPKRTQSRKGWRTQSYGNGVWRTQMGRIEWFDRAMDGQQDRYRAAVQQAMDDMAERIASRTRGG